MGVKYWNAGAPLLLVLPNVTALLVLALTFLVLNWPPVSITSPAAKFSRGGVQIVQLEKSSNCSRPCLDGGKTKECYFKFVLEPVLTAHRGCSDCEGNGTDCRKSYCIPADGVQRVILSVNRKLPGTAVRVCEGDVVVVDVQSHLPGLETSLHWHGQNQRGSPYMDGVPMITQCPIQSGTTFRYTFRALNPGTHFYHSHYVSHHADGIFGPFIVRQPVLHDPNSHLYDYDLDEHILMLSSWSHEISSYSLDIQESMEISSILINGEGSYFNPPSRTRSHLPKTRFSVKQGSRYRFRIINAVSVDCPVQLQIESHNMTIIASDGAPVKSRPTSHLLLLPGERYDIIISADQAESSYWIVVRGHHQCENLHQEALLVYNGAAVLHEFNETTKSSLKALSAVMKQICPKVTHMTCRPQEIKNNHRIKPAELQASEADMKLFIPFDVHVYDGLKDTDVNFSFMMEEPPYYPSYLYNRKFPMHLSQVDRLTFKYPPFPLLSQPESVPPEMLCSDGCQHLKFCECLHIVRAPVNVTLDVVLVDEGYGSNHSNTFHLHGYSFLVLGSESLGRPVDVAEVKLNDSLGMLPRNLMDAPRKDTVIVPNKGYTIIRLFTDNPGYWLFEAHSTNSVTGAGMQFIVQVGEQIHLPPVPPKFPRCGLHKGLNFI